QESGSSLIRNRAWHHTRTRAISELSGRISLKVVNNWGESRAVAQLGFRGDGTRPRTAFLLVSLSGQSRFQLGLLSRRHEESMLLRVFGDFLSHHLALEAAHCALDRFAGIYINYCHLFLQLVGLS